MNNNWTQEELESLEKLKHHNLKVIQAHFPDKHKMTIQSALYQLEDRLKNKENLPSRKDNHFRAINITAETNLVLYGLMVVKNITAKSLAEKVDCSVRTIQGAVQGRKLSSELMKRISDVLETPEYVIFWQQK